MIYQMNWNLNDNGLKNLVCLMTITVSMLVVMFGHDPETKNWAFGTTGMIIGRVLGANNRTRGRK